VRTGARVIAIEPLAEMRELLARIVPAAELLEGTAENLPLASASVDAVTVGQAFHWFDADRAVPELARVLEDSGALALVWNIRDLADPFQAHLNRLLRPYQGGAPSEHEQPWRPSLDGSPLFGPAELESFEWEQTCTREQLVERVASVSFVALLPPASRETLLGEVRQLADELGDVFPFRYRTDVYVFPRSGEPARG
jgi:SAM-dependent methyltransferase